MEFTSCFPAEESSFLIHGCGGAVAGDFFQQSCYWSPALSPEYHSQFISINDVLSPALEATEADTAAFDDDDDSLPSTLAVNPPLTATEAATDAIRGSAFTPYSRPTSRGTLSPSLARSSSCSASLSTTADGAAVPRGGGFVHRRVIEFLRRLHHRPPRPPRVQRSGERTPAGGSRVFRHMMRERKRREKLSESYADLYSMLPVGSKADKNSIVQSSAVRVWEMKKAREELQKRNMVLKSRLVAKEVAAFGGGRNTARIGMTVPTIPGAAIDTMIAALRCMKDMRVRSSQIQADCSASAGELSARMTLETEVATSEVERAVQGALMEVRRKLSYLGTALPGL